MAEDMDQHGLLGIRNQDHSGRSCQGTVEDREWLCETVKDAPHQLRVLYEQFQVRTGLGSRCHGIRCSAGLKKGWR
ncbi:MAG: hypothetical protein ACXW00_03940 [Methylobacter sp.]